VGFTSQTPESRLRNHISQSLARRETYKERGICSLLSVGLTPLIEVVESGSGDGWEDAERRWIAFYRSRGARLWNTTDGGEGVPGWGTPEQRSAQKRFATVTAEQRSTSVRKGRENLTPEQRTAISKKSAAAKDRRATQ